MVLTVSQLDSVVAQSAFPSLPLDAGLVSGGGVGTLDGRLSSAFLNPANLVRSPGVHATLVQQDLTGLRGNSVHVGMDLGASAAVAVWRYEVSDLFDDDLIELDPSLSSLSISVTGVAVGAGVRRGKIRLAALWSVQFHDNLGQREEQGDFALGVKYTSVRWSVGAAWSRGTLGSIRSRHAIRAGLELAPFTGGSRAPTLAADVGWRSSEFETMDSWVTIPIGPVSVLAGRRWVTGQFTGGLVLSVRAVAVHLGREFAGTNTVGNLNAITLSVAL